jgi:uncharacterized protein
MKKIFTLIVVLFFGYANAQNDTIWLNDYKEVASRDGAKYFQKVKKIKDSLFNITQFTLKGIKILDGNSKVDNTTLFDGEVNNFYDDGKIAFTQNYRNGSYEGKSVSYLKDGTKSEGVFKDNALYDGKILYEINDDIYEYEVLQGLRNYDRIYSKFNPLGGYKSVYEDNRLVKQISYNNKGENIGEATYGANYSDIDGVVGYYNYGPTSLNSLIYYKNQKVEKTDSFFKNGKVKSIQKIETGYRNTQFFDDKGNEIGILTEKEESPDYYIPQDGTQVNYGYLPENIDNIEMINYYENRKNTKALSYDKTGNKLKLVKYNENLYPIFAENYDKSGKVESTLTYGGEYNDPIDGKLIEENATSIYKNKNIVSKIVKYKSGKTFSNLDNGIASFYDQKGVLMSTLSYYDKYNSGKISDPKNGIEYTMYDDNISGYSKYTEGNLSEIGSYNINFKDRKILESQVTYNAAVMVIKDLSFFKNGKKKIEKIQNGGYSVLKEIAYNNNGKIIAEFDNINQEGTQYTYFNASDDIESIKTYKNKTLTYEKLYKNSYDANSFSTKIALDKEIDYFKEGTFYENGKPLYKTTYKDGLPYSGKVLVVEEYYTKKIDNYENGMKNGEQLIYEINNNNLTHKYIYEDNIQKRVFFYTDNILTKEANIENDLMNGEAIFYDATGNIISKAIYKDDVIFDGETSETSGNQETRIIYASGNATNTIIKTDGIVTRNSKLLDLDTLYYQVENFYPSGKLESIYKTKNAQIDGDVIFYNENGSKETEAKCELGKLISGKLKLNKPSNLPSDSRYMYLSKTKKGFELIGYLDNKKPEFKVIEEQMPQEKIFEEKVSVGLINSSFIINAVNPYGISETDLFSTNNIPFVSPVIYAEDIPKDAVKPPVIMDTKK